MTKGWVTANIVEQVDWAAGLRTLRLDQRLDFIPGQFVNLALDAGPERTKRSYSVASAPGAPVEVYITRVERGLLSEPLFERGVGDNVFMEAMSYGFLTIDQLPEFARDLWLLSTGTGLAPFLSMLRSGQLFPRFDKVLVVNGVRENAHLAYEAELRELEGRSEGKIRYVGLVTRESPSGKHLAGRIPQAIEDGRLEHALDYPFDVKRSHFMLCGNPDMIGDAMTSLALRGMKRHRRRDPGHISVEKYW
jgi:ferredoxin/flavodoxin---NADP+ reductase